MEEYQRTCGHIWKPLQLSRVTRIKEKLIFDGRLEGDEEIVQADKGEKGKAFQAEEAMRAVGQELPGYAGNKGKESCPWRQLVGLPHFSLPSLASRVTLGRSPLILSSSCLLVKWE